MSVNDYVFERRTPNLFIYIINKNLKLLKPCRSEMSVNDYVFERRTPNLFIYIINKNLKLLKPCRSDDISLLVSGWDSHDMQ